MDVRSATILAGALLVGVLTTAAPAAGSPLPPQIHTVSTAAMGRADSVAALPGGAFLYVDETGDEVLEQSKSGKVSVVAGNGTTIDAPDGTPATQSGLNDPVAVAPLPDGSFLITEAAGAVVRIVSPGAPGTATITTVAGTGAEGNNGSSGPATSIELNYPRDAVPTSDGRVLIADWGNDAIRLVSAAAPGATLSTIAGGGACSDSNPSCNGLAAGAVALDHPVAVSPIQGGAGGYLIAENNNLADNTIREVSQLSPGGTFTTVAGVPGIPGGFSGDGGPATAAQLNSPAGVMSTPDGGFLIADTANQRIRAVSPAGAIATVAGTGNPPSYAGDGGDATAASLNAPAGLSPATDSDGAFLIADSSNGAIREVTLPPVSTIALSSQPTGLNGWYLSAVAVTVSSSEKGTTQCELDPPQPPPVYDAMLPSCTFNTGTLLEGNGTHVIYAASVNAAGDKELPVSVTVKMDLTAGPQVTCVRAAPFPYGARRAKVAATVSESVAGPLTPVVFARVNTGRAGPHTVKLTGESNAGERASVDCRYAVLPARFKPEPRLQSSLTGGDVRQLTVTNIPWIAAVNVACSGNGCPLSSLLVPKPRRRYRGFATVSLTPLFSGARLSPGAQVTVTVTAPNTIGQRWTITNAGRRSPSVRSSCVAPSSWILPRHCT